MRELAVAIVALGFSGSARAQVTERVDVDSNGGQSGAGGDLSPGSVVSADGRFVMFMSSAPLVPGDTNANWDIFVRDRLNATTERVSVDSNGAQGNGHSTLASISADGRFVGFTSTATNLVPGDTNG